MSATPPLVIPGRALDFYLSQGYYRMHQDLFTCAFLPVGEEVYTVHWLRMVLAAVEYGPAQRRLLRQAERFTIRITPFELTDELEELYARYRQSISFDAPDTVETFLLNGATHNVFQTETLELREAGRLVAAGVFDAGERTMAGIMNFYDPDYRKFSLGKMLMLLKMEEARRRHYTHYYPGYLVHGYPKFDYKLFPCPPATEVFDCLREEWHPFSWERVDAQNAAVMGV